MSCDSSQCSRSLPSSSLPLPSLQAFAIPSPFAGFGRMCRRFATRSLWFYDRQLQRRALVELDDRMLADIGLSRAQANAEGRKPFWL